MFSGAANQHVRMISGGSCDAEDSDFHFGNILNAKIYI